jgi:RNA polymerase subunit RPABC4/transcription elongation factor Spt4
MGSCIDLRTYQDANAIQDAFAKLVSGGKMGYKTVIERKKILPKCSKCGRGGDDGQKFCPQCGGQMAIPITNCPKCNKPVDGEKFCTECGQKLFQD